MRLIILGYMLLQHFFADAQRDPIRLEWYSRVSFDTLKYIGCKQLFKQECTGDSDSLVITGVAIFKNARLKHAGRCQVSRYYKDTIYQKVTIEMNKYTSFDSLFHYFNLLSRGKYSSSSNKHLIIYNATIHSEEAKNLSVTFVTDRKRKHPMLIIEPAGI